MKYNEKEKKKSESNRREEKRMKLSRPTLLGCRQFCLWQPRLSSCTLLCAVLGVNKIFIFVFFLLFGFMLYTHNERRKITRLHMHERRTRLGRSSPFMFSVELSAHFSFDISRYLLSSTSEDLRASKKVLMLSRCWLLPLVSSSHPEPEESQSNDDDGVVSSVCKWVDWDFW